MVSVAAVASRRGTIPGQKQMVLALHGLEFKGQRFETGWRHSGATVMNEDADRQPANRADNRDKGSE